MRGFTLIESLVYIILFGIIISGGLVGTQSLAESADRMRAESLLLTEGDFLSSKIELAPSEIRLVGSSLAYATATSTIPLSSPAISVSGFSRVSSTHSSTYYFSLSTLTSQGQKISKNFSVLIPTFP
jgi:prepilin-type N-terminal cleavage/methylation domain-containing protein